MLGKLTIIVTVATTMAIAGVATSGEIPSATAREADFFVGRWATGPSPVDGFETLPATPPSCDRPVEIRRIGPDRIERQVRGRDGRPTTSTFTVKRFAGNFPWWPSGGGAAPVARRVDQDVFDLAPTRLGRADWSQAIRHQRCPAVGSERYAP